MNFDYSEEQQLLADSVRRLLQKDYEFEARRKIVASEEGYSPAIWAKFAEMASRRCRCPRSTAALAAAPST